LDFASEVNTGVYASFQLMLPVILAQECDTFWCILHILTTKIIKLGKICKVIPQLLGWVTIASLLSLALKKERNLLKPKILYLPINLYIGRSCKRI